MRRLVATALIFSGLACIDGSESRSASTSTAPNHEEVRPTREEIVWLTHEAEARARAASLRRPMLIVFTADWSVHSREIERLLELPSVRARGQSFVGLRIPWEESDAYDAVQRSFGVRGIPTVLVLDAEGREVYRAHAVQNEAERELGAALEEAWIRAERGAAP